MKQNIKILNKDSISNSVKPSHTGAEAKRKINTDPVYLKFDFFPSWIIFLHQIRFSQSAASQCY